MFIFFYALKEFM